MTDKKLIFITLRGGMDGLHALPPRPFDIVSNYRPSTKREDFVPLNSKFFIHSKLDFVRELFKSRQLSILPACGMPNNKRSHFRAQDYLESGHKGTSNLSGWMARCMSFFDPEIEAVAFDTILPLLLSGHEKSFNWTGQPVGRSVESYLSNLDSDFYAGYPELVDALRKLSKLAKGPETNASNLSSRLRPFLGLANMMKRKDAPQVGFYPSGNWDMHDRLNRRANAAFTELNAGLRILVEGLGAEFKNTIILVFSEFGRTVRENGTGGTDHGTGGTALIMGGNYKGGKILGDWPGLEEHQLFEGRDVMPVNDIRELFIDAINIQFGWNKCEAWNIAFPENKKSLWFKTRS